MTPKFDPHLSDFQHEVAQLVAEGRSYPHVARLTGSNPRLVRHHACEAARKIAPDSPRATRQILTLWWLGVKRKDI